MAKDKLKKAGYWKTTEIRGMIHGEFIIFYFGLYMKISILN